MSEKIEQTKEINRKRVSSYREAKKSKSSLYNYLVKFHKRQDFLLN